MPISFSCPSCSKKLSVPDTVAGKAAKCPCGAQITIPTPASQSVAQQPVAAAAQTMPQGNAAMTGNPSALQNPGVSAPASFNPEFKIQCMQCGTEYPMQPHLVGQTVACQCGAPLRFEDPLGTGGLMSASPLGVTTADPLGQPTAYASQSGGGVEQVSRQKQEEDVLRTYLKDEYDATPPGSSKPKGSSKSNGSSNASLWCSIVGIIAIAATAVSFAFDATTAMIIVIVVHVGLGIFVTAGIWQMFEKAGSPGITSIIPIYSLIILIRIAGKPDWWFFLFLIPIFNIVAAISLCLEIAKRFGKGNGFGIGLAFLGFIFFPILGFGTARYTQIN